MKVKPIDVEKPADVRELLHEAVVYGRIRGIDGITPADLLVVGRRRPYVPAGEDPTPVNIECARRFAVDLLGREPVCVEVRAEDVEPFIDVAARLREADEHANRAQRKNARTKSKSAKGAK